MNNLHKLDAAIKAICPINGVNSDRVISFTSEATAEQRAAAQAIADSWDFGASVHVKQFTSLEFLDLFTEDEQLAVITAAMQSAQVKRWYDRTLAAMFITLDDPRTEAGLDALVAAGMLTAERKVAIVEAMS